MDESMFKLFLKFVYTGHLDTNKMSMEEVINMLAVADRYEVWFDHTLIMWSSWHSHTDSFTEGTLWAVTDWTS